MLLIHRVLQGAQTTFAVKSISYFFHSLTTGPRVVPRFSAKRLNVKRFLPVPKRSPTHSLQICSPDNFASDGQKAQLGIAADLTGRYEGLAGAN